MQEVAMKRQNHLFELIVDYQNFRLAFLRAVRGKKPSPSMMLFRKNLDTNLEHLRNSLTTGEYTWGQYRSFTITDPKPRIISSAPFEDRVVHHAIINILEPLFERRMVYHSYACRKDKGTQRAIMYAFRQCKKSPWFLKLDVHKYFDSIDHGVLKTMLASLIKDGRTLLLLSELIDNYHRDTGKGVPIGNLTSQFFANLYLSGLDHYILEELRPHGYTRYMDDVNQSAGLSIGFRVLKRRSPVRASHGRKRRSAYSASMRR
jgi:retron-type reverse transcriptase